MQKWERFWLTVAMVALFFFSIAPLTAPQSQIEGVKPTSEAIAQAESSPDTPSQLPTVNPQTTGFPVVLGKKTLLTIEAETPQMYASQRAQIATRQITRIAQDDTISLDTLVLQPNREVMTIAQIDADGNRSFILEVTSNDAQAAQRPLKALADDWFKIIQDEIAQYREKHSRQRQLFAMTATVVATLILVILILVINRLVATMRRYLGSWQETRAQPLRFQNLDILTVRAQGLLLQHLLSVLRWLLIICCFFSYSLVITFFFPQTEELGGEIINFFTREFASAWATLVNFLPDLFMIVVTIFIARFFLRVNRLVFDALEAGRISWPGFYPDWARPTRDLLTLLIWGVTVAIIFPYLPGSHSPAIQGLGLLGGALLTVGGAGTVASLISGYVIIYSRAFQEGDVISFDNYQGIVEQKSVLATQIRSLNGEILTIPNSALQSKSIINYSAVVRDFKLPLALQTTITLGYDVPWRQVHQVLVAAARTTPEVLTEPAPFVLQTSLDDFYVSYQLKAFINQPEKLPQIYSNLLQNIQDHCNEAGIEILSPHYTALRDGNQNTIPAAYLPKDYNRPGFQIDLPHTSEQ